MENPDYTLTVRTPVHKLAAKTGTPSVIPRGNITKRVKDTWQRSKVWTLGDDQGQFSLTGSLAELRKLYDTWLTYDVVEMTAGGIVTWNGYIAMMVLQWGFMPRSIDYSTVANKVISTVGDGIGTYTAAATSAKSIAAYGLRIVYLQPGVETLAAANAERDDYLLKNAWPNEEPSGGDASSLKEPRLDVFVMGYKSTLNNLYADDPAIIPEDGISDALDITIDGSLHINVRSIAANTTTLYDDVELIQSGELVKKLLRVSDGSGTGNLYRGWIDGYRNFYYKQIGSTPIYYVRGGEVFGSPGDRAKVSPRLLEPGIYRDLDSPLSGPHRDSFFEDRRDIWVGGIFVDANGKPRWQPEKSTVADYQSRYWSKVNE